MGRGHFSRFDEWIKTLDAEGCAAESKTGFRGRDEGED
jgi:hypothetical protein